MFLAVDLWDISRPRLNDNPNNFFPDKLFGLWRCLIVYFFIGSPRFLLLLTQFVGHIIIFDPCPKRRTACTPSAPLRTCIAPLRPDGVNKLVNQIHQSQYNPHSDSMYESTLHTCEARTLICSRSPSCNHLLWTSQMYCFNNANVTSPACRWQSSTVLPWCYAGHCRR